MRESSNPRAAAELACVVGRDFQMMWQEGEAEERIQEGDLQGTTEKSRKKTQTGHVNRDIFLVVDEIMPNFVRNELTS